MPSFPPPGPEPESDIDLSSYHPRGQAVSPPDPDVPASPPPSGVQLWCYRGATLLSDDNGVISLNQLERFFAVCATMPKATILVHAYGLRAIDTQEDGRNAGPHLDWRDWR